MHVDYKQDEDSEPDHRRSHASNLADFTASMIGPGLGKFAPACYHSRLKKLISFNVHRHPNDLNGSPHHFSME
jgi:hypothetical protein